jgi:hypothetical protein
MTIWSANVSKEWDTVFAVFNSVACFVFITLLLYYQRIGEIKLSKLSVTALLSMLGAFSQCLASVNIQAEWFLGNPGRFCDLSMKLTTTSYAVHRALLYMFIILRSEVVNTANFVETRIIYASKIVIALDSVLMVSLSAIFAQADEECGFEFNKWLILLISFFDLCVCGTGTYLFIRPVRQLLKFEECERLKRVLGKMMFWSTISLISTVVAILTVLIIDGAAGVVGFDCSLTSFCLLRMMTPVKYEEHSQSNKNSNQQRGVEMQNTNQKIN